MLSLLCPQWVFDDYTAVTPEFLHARGVKLLLSDLDFTLAPKKQSEPDEKLKAWIDRLQATGIEVAILSNNRSSVRVEKFCKPLGIGYVEKARHARLSRGHGAQRCGRGRNGNARRQAADRYARRAPQRRSDADGRTQGWAGRRVEPCAACIAGAVQSRKRARRAEKTLKFANFTHNIRKNTCIAALYAVKYHRFRTDTL